MNFNSNTARILFDFVEANKNNVSENDYIMLCNATKNIHDQCHSDITSSDTSVHTSPEWYYHESTDTYVRASDETRFVRNPFSRTAVPNETSWVPAYIPYVFEPSEDNKKIRMLEASNKNLKQCIKTKENILEKNQRVCVSDKYNVLLRIIIHHNLNHITPYNIKTVTDKISYFEELILKTNSVGISKIELKNLYVAEKVSRINQVKREVLNDIAKYQRKINKNNKTLVELRS